MFLELRILFVIVQIQEIMRKSYISCQKRAYFDVTSGNFANLDSEKVHEDEIFGQEDILQFFSGESKD